MSHLAFARTIVGNLFSKPATRLYPFVKREPIVGSRGAVAIELEKCIMCGICQKRCPADAIVVNRAERVWAIDRMRCIWCGACVDACPKDCLSLLPTYTPPSTSKSIDSFKQETPPPKPQAAAPA
jgi:ech hydrogenase subunit F